MKTMYFQPIRTIVALVVVLVVPWTIGCRSTSRSTVSTYEYTNDPFSARRGQPASGDEEELTSEYQMVSPGEMVAPGEPVVDPK